MLQNNNIDKTYCILNYTRIKPRSRPPQKKSAYFTHPDFSAAKIEKKKCSNYESKYCIFRFRCAKVKNIPGVVMENTDPIQENNLQAAEIVTLKRTALLCISCFPIVNLNSWYNEYVKYSLTDRECSPLMNTNAVIVAECTIYAAARFARR